MARLLLTRSRELIASQPLIFLALTVWAFAPVVRLLFYVAGHGGTLTGANGADPLDQMAYLAWIRDEGAHFLSSDLWQIGPTAHDYLHPMYVISGLLWRLGASVQLAYLIWKPVALLVLFLGCAAYVHRLLPDSRGQQAAALALALFYVSPVLALADWTGHLTLLHRLQLELATDDAYSALNLWGFEHAAITIGLMPVFLLAGERLVTDPRAEHRLGLSVVAAIAGGLVSWLHPWQGLMLLAIVGGLVIVAPPRRRYVALAVPVIGTVLPLVYGVLLARYDPVWRTFQHRTIGQHTAPWWALIASFGLPGVFAALGFRRPRSVAEWMLVLWLASCVAVYFIVPEFPPHALVGITVPLAILAVRGWRRVRVRLRVSAAVATAAAVVAVLAVTVPGVIDHAKQVNRALTSSYQRELYTLTPDESAALAYVDNRPPGGVLAPWFLSLSVPGLTGHTAFAGHPMWQPPGNPYTASVFFSSGVKGAIRRQILRSTGARYVIANCDSPPQLAAQIALVARLARRFGCVSVYATG